MVSNQTKTNGLVPVHQQILALVSAPFGDSPLLKNLLPVSIISYLMIILKQIKKYVIVIFIFDFFCFYRHLERPKNF